MARRALLLLLLGLVWLAADTSDALYTAQVTVRNNTGATQSEIAAPFPLSTQALLNGDFMDSDTLDAELHDASGLDVPLSPGPIRTRMQGAVLDDGATVGSGCGGCTTDTTDMNDSGASDVDLLPATPAANDAFYFGADHRYRVLWLDIGTAGEGTWELAWEYWNGASWTALSSVTDDTSGFTTAGLLTVTWDMPSDWATTDASGDLPNDTYWVRARVSSFTSVTTSPDATQGWYDLGQWWQYVDSLADGSSAATTLHTDFTDQGRAAYARWNQADGAITVTDDAAIQDIWDGGGTVEVWIYPHGDGPNNFGRILSKTQWELFIQNELNGKVHIQFRHLFSGDNGIWTTLGRQITVGEWTHIAVTYDADDTTNDPTIYINGSSVSIDEANAPSGTRTTDSGSDLLIGNRAALDRAFDGFLDEARLWNDIRTTSEIQDNDEADLVGNEAGLVGLWELDDAEGFTATDQTANANNGTLAGVFWGSDHKDWHYYMPGTDGVTASDDADLELSNDFEVFLQGYLDTAGGSGRYIARKDAAFRILNDASEQITVQLFDSTNSFEELSPNGDSSISLTANGCPSNNFECVDESGGGDGDTTYLSTTSSSFVGDSFDIEDTGLASSNQVSSVQIFYRAAKGTLGDTVEARSLLDFGAGTTTITGDTEALTTSYIQHSDTYSRPDGGNWDVSDLDDIRASIQLRTDNAANDAKVTQVFVHVTYDSPDDTLQATGVADGEHIISVDTAGATSSEIRLVIDGTVHASTTLLSIQDNPQPWEFASGGPVVWMERLYIEQPDGTDVLEYRREGQHDAITLTDNTGGEDGTPSWPAPIADLAGSVASFQGTSAPQAVAQESALHTDAVGATDGLTGFAASLSVPTALPGYDAVNALSDAAGLPVELPFIGFFVLLALLTLIGSWKGTQSGWFALLCSGFVLVLAFTVISFPLWVVVVFGVLGVTILIFGKGVVIGA